MASSVCCKSRWRRATRATHSGEWSAGAGFRVRAWQFDYAWQDNARDLGGTQRWSAGVRF